MVSSKKCLKLHILAVAFYIGMVGVSYQLTGMVAKEREIGMAQLLDSMMPNKARWQPQAARIMANHFAFDLMYLPGWIVMSIILSVGVFTQTSFAIMLFTNILAGLAPSSLSCSPHLIQLPLSHSSTYT